MSATVRANGTDAFLEVEELSVNRGSHAVLKDITLSVHSGQIVAIVGPNGAGKTTLMESVVGRTRVTAGKVSVGGRRVDRHPGWCRRQIGYADQELAIFPTLTVHENVWGWAAMVGLFGAARAKAGDAAIDTMCLGAVRHRPVRTLSGGERRRVHCAMAIVAKPPLLLLDEPTVGVDPETRRAVLEHVRLLASQGAAICYSTHYLPEVEHLGADVVLLRAGRVLAAGGMRELLARYGQQVIELRVHGDGTKVVPSDDPARDVPLLLDELRRAGKQLDGLEVRSPSLDDVFERVVVGGQSDIAR